MTEDTGLPRRAHLGLDLARPTRGRGLEVMEVVPRSPLDGRVAPGARLMAIDDARVDDLDGVRALVRALPAGHRATLRFEREGQEEIVRCALAPLPRESVPGGRVELAEVDCEDYRLRAVFTFPDRAGPAPLVWLLPSAIWLSEEHPHEPWHPTLALVQALTRCGLATLRVDRSGVGDSEGPPCVDTDLETELAWCRAAHDQLLGHPAVDADRWFLFGRSLGGTLVQLLAHELRPRAAAVWGATSLDWHTVMMRATELQRRMAGHGGPALDAYLDARRRLSEAVLIEGLLPREALAREPALHAVRAEFEGGRVHGRLARFFQQLQRRDVAAACGRYEGEMLVMRGALDWITSAQDAASVVAAARAPTFVFFDGVDHLMHRRESIDEAFTHTFGGDFDPSGAEVMARFFTGRFFTGR